VRLDISSEVGRRAASHYGGVRAVPTLILLSDNTPIYKQTGLVQPGEVIDQVDQLLANP
jgi:hypothetical protein